MALPAHILDKLSPELRKNLVLAEGRQPWASPPLADAERLGSWGEPLAQGALPQGAITELALTGGLGWGTPLALMACRQAQNGNGHWAAYVDPSRSLYAPGVKRAGVDLSRLLVVQPDLMALTRTCLRIVESRIFSVVVIDLVGTHAASLDIPLGRWVKVLRRLSVALEGSSRSVVLLTDLSAHRPLTLPVSHRLEISRSTLKAFDFRVGRSHGLLRPLAGHGRQTFETPLAHVS